MSKKTAIIALIIGALMLVQPLPAFAAAAFTSITCADPEGNEITTDVGWDNSNLYFNGKGDIPRLYCEGGHAGIYTTYISDTLEPDSPLRWYNGIAPTPTPEPTVEPTPEPSASTEPTLEPSTEPTQSPEPEVTPTLEPTPEEPTPTPEATLEPTVEPTPTIESPGTPSPEPTPEPQTQAPVVAPVLEPTPTPTATPEIVETPIPEPTIEPTPLAAPIVNPQVQTIELPEALQIVGVIQLAAAAEAVMNVGSDMSDEEREEAQIVAIAAIIVSQIAGSIRRITK
jgi:hypothetical protein